VNLVEVWFQANGLAEGGDPLVGLPLHLRGEAEVAVGQGVVGVVFDDPWAKHVSAISFSPDGTALATTLQTGNLVVWDLKSGRELQPFPTCTLADGPLAFSPDGSTIATSGGGPTLHFWDRTTGKDRLATPDAHDDIVAALLFLGKGETLVSGSDDRTVRIWDLDGSPARAARVRTVLRHRGWVRTMAVSPDETLLASGTSYPAENSVYLWDLKTGEKRRTISSVHK
jgi:WD40 repeat protein